MSNRNLDDKHFITHDCKGTNPACRKARKEGRPLHMVPMNFEGQSVVLPDCHFVDLTQALTAYELVATQGVLVHNSTERDAAYADDRIVIFASDYKI